LKDESADRKPATRVSGLAVCKASKSDPVSRTLTAAAARATHLQARWRWECLSESLQDVFRAPESARRTQRFEALGYDNPAKSRQRGTTMQKILFLIILTILS
jgi:hypothetical protein